MTLTTLPAPLLLEVHTEHFVDVKLCLQAAGFSVAARPDFPNRHIVRDDLPEHLRPRGDSPGAA